MAHAIKSDQLGAIARLKEKHQNHISEAEEGIKRLCNKKFTEFIDANAGMEEFKTSLRQVRGDLGQIQE